MRNVDLFALGVIESVHGVDAGQHGEAPEAHEGEEERCDEADQQSNRHHVAAVPVGSEVVLDAEDLQLNLGQSDANSENKSKSFNLDQFSQNAGKLIPT